MSVLLNQLRLAADGLAELHGEDGGTAMLREAATEIARFQRELEAEREAHAETRRQWTDEVKCRGANQEAVMLLESRLTTATALLREVRPVLCDVMKLASDLGQPEDYDKVAALVDRIDAWLEGR